MCYKTTAYKGFHKDLTCTMGRGVFTFEPGKTYWEESEKCANRGFHAATNPLDVLSYYNGKEDRYFIVELLGDLDEDGKGTRVSAQGIRLVKEISKRDLYVHGAMWVVNHPLAEWSKSVKKDTGSADGSGVVIVRGKAPKAKGKKGDLLILLCEGENESIAEAGVFEVDGDICKEDVYYNVGGEHEKIRS